MGNSGDSKEERALAKSELRHVVVRASLDDCRDLLKQAVWKPTAKVGDWAMISQRGSIPEAPFTGETYGVAKLPPG